MRVSTAAAVPAWRLLSVPFGVITRYAERPHRSQAEVKGTDSDISVQIFGPMPYAEVWPKAPRNAGLGQHIDYLTAVESSIARRNSFMKHSI